MAGHRLRGGEDDWAQLQEVWGDAFAERLGRIAAHKQAIRVRMLGGTQVGYARVTRRWWEQVTGTMRSQSLRDRPVYFVSSNSHSLANLVTGVARHHEASLVELVERRGPDYLRAELERFRTGQAEGDWNNFLYYAARLHTGSIATDERGSLRREERERGVHGVASRTALDVAAQVIPLDRLDPASFDPRLGPVDVTRLRGSQAVIVNIDYPLGLAAYNILREVGETVAELRGVYILGKAATLNADVGDVMISNVVHDEHSGCTYWLNNAFTVADIAPHLRFGSGLDNQRTVSVKGTFLQNRGYLDFYYREAFTVVEMEVGPYCNAIYEISEAERYPTGEPVNFSSLPLDFGIIHYASDTPFTQARTLGARGLSYFGMDSTYASSVAILRRILEREGALGQPPATPAAEPAATPAGVLPPAAGDFDRLGSATACPCSAPPNSRSPMAPRPSSPASTCAWSAGPGWPWWGPTGPASRRCSTSWPATSSRARGASTACAACAAPTCPRTRPPRWPTPSWRR